MTTLSRPDQRFGPLGGRLRIFWFGVLIGFPVLMTGLFFALISQGLLEPEGYLPIPAPIGLSAMLAGCMGLLLAAKLLVSRLMDPASIARSRLPATGRSLSPQEEIEQCVQNRMVLAVAILDAPLMIGLALELVTADHHYVLLILVYGVLVAVIAKPDIERIAAATERSLVMTRSSA